MNKILIIDDTKENLEAVKDLLEELIPDCVVITTESGKEGLKAARDIQPDVIISDVFMPEIDGIEVCKRLKSDKTTQQIPIVIHTGSTTDAESRIQCLDAGADVFLAKPIDAGELTAQINAMLRIKKAEDRLREEKELLDEAVHKRTRELQESEESLRLVIENIPFAVFAHDLDGKFVLVNKTSTEFTGYTKRELLSKTVADIDHNSISRDDREKIWQQLQYGEQKQLFSTHYRKDGSQYPVEVHLTALLLKNEPVILALVKNITKRKIAEEQLKGSEARFRKLFESSKDAIMTLEPPTWKFTSGNKAIFDTFGVKNLEEFTSLEPWKVSPKKQPDGNASAVKAKKEIQKAMKNGSNFFEWTHKRKNGEEFPATVLLTRVDLAGKSFLQATVRDITERKREEKIQKTLFDISNAMNTTKNIKELFSKIREFLGDIIDTTNFYVALYDEKTDMISLPFDVDEKDKFETFPAGKTITKYVIKTGKYLFATKDVVKKLIKKGLIETVGSPSEIWLGVPLKIENKVIGVIAVQSYDNPNLYTEKDIEILNFISDEIALAINRKQAEDELKVNRERLKTANSILRHDIANDLIVIKSALDIYKEEQDKSMLDEIEKRVEKGLNTIKRQREQEQFLDSHSDLDEYHIDQVIKKIIKDYPDIICNVSGTGKAYADNAIYSIVENIISNAIRHGKSTKLDIDITYNEDFCEIRFADDGIGIPDEIKHKVFDKGFQYGEYGHTGIGLYIVQKAVDDYGGDVFVEDNTPKGIVFVIRLKKTIER